MSVATAVGIAEFEPREGWGFLQRNTGAKAHYFVAGRSLCGAHVTPYEIELEEDEGYPSPDDCVNCRRHFDARMVVPDPA